MAEPPRNNVWQITGPPGCGKTTKLITLAKEAISKYGGKKILVASLTRAASFEFQSRGLQGIPQNQIGTLHSICLHALGDPELTAGKEKDWEAFLEEQEMSTRFRLGKNRKRKDEDGNRGETDGDKLLNRLTVIRSQNPPNPHQSNLPQLIENFPGLSLFNRLWGEWKEDRQLLDFTDLLEQCLIHVERAPGDPQFIYGDEAQDWSQLEIQLFREHWGQHAEGVYLFGDPDQSIYVWRGADSRIFLDHPVPANQKILLNQSYRVPSEVRDYALAWIEAIVEDREPVEYKARQGGMGSVSGINARYSTPLVLTNLLGAASKSTKTCMIMATCDYMLRPLIGQLQMQGIPYSNPYRANDRSWNPLLYNLPKRGGKKAEVTRLDRLLTFLSMSRELRGQQTVDWTWADIEKWTAPLRAKGDDAVLVHGAKAQISRLAKDIPGPKAINIDIFQSLFVGEGWKGHANNAIRADLDWWLDSMLETETKGYRYFKNIIDSRGQRALVETPVIWVGTIHSFKGGEADNVFVFPDLSPAAYKLWVGGDQDDTGRLFYVGITRAKQNLILCRPENPLNVNLPYGGISPDNLLDTLTSEDCEVPF